MITNSKVLIVPHWGLGDLIYFYGLVKYIAERNTEVIYLVKDCYLEPGSILYRDLSNVSLLPLSKVSSATPHKSGWIDIKKEQLEHDHPDFTILLMGGHARRAVDISIYPLSFYDDVGVPRSMLWTKYNIYYSEDSIALHKEICDLSYAVIDTLSFNGHVFDSRAAIAHIGINIESILTINLHENIYPVGHRFYDIAQKIIGRRPITDYISILENASYLVLSDSAMHALCHLLYIKSQNNYVIGRDRHSGSFIRLYNEELYGDINPDMRVKFTRIWI